MTAAATEAAATEAAATEAAATEAATSTGLEGFGSAVVTKQRRVTAADAASPESTNPQSGTRVGIATKYVVFNGYSRRQKDQSTNQHTK